MWETVESEQILLLARSHLEVGEVMTNKALEGERPSLQRLSWGAGWGDICGWWSVRGPVLQYSAWGHDKWACLGLRLMGSKWRYVCNVALFGHLRKEEVKPTAKTHASLLLSWRKHNLRFVTAQNFQTLFSQTYWLTALILNWMQVTEYKKTKYCDIFSKNADINILHINWAYMCILNVLKFKPKASSV